MGHDGVVVHEDTVILLTGSALTVPQIVGIAHRQPVLVAAERLDAVAASRRAADDAVAHARDEGGHRGEVYGRTTGVGANKDQAVDGHGVSRSLLRSHALGWGPTMTSDLVRAGVGVRLNQILCGRSGLSVEVVGALEGLLAGPDADLPQVCSRGAIGTGDLAPLAQVALALVGEGPRADGRRHGGGADFAGDALAFMSSNAFALAAAALSASEARRLARVALTVTALTHRALRGAREAYGPVVAAATPFPGAVACARQVLDLLGPRLEPSRHLQDFFGLRTFPQVHGPLLDALDHLDDVITALANAPSENPAFDPGADVAAAHHGGFHTAYLSAALDGVLTAAAGSATLSMSRLAHLLTDPGDDLPRFLTDGRPGSSGLMALEYVGASAVTEVRMALAAARAGTNVHLSQGVEDDAGFSPQRAAALSDVAAAYRQLLAVELMAAVRALRLRGIGPESVGGKLGEPLARCAVLSAETRDRDLRDDLRAALALTDDPAFAPEFS